jgi:hypothetical protein
MSRGGPVRVTPDLGAAAIARCFGGGFVVAGNPDTLAGAIMLSTKTPWLSRSKRKAGRRHVAAHYCWGGAAVTMEALYESLTAR